MSGLGPADHLVEQLGRLLGRGVGEDLDLVELVGAQQAPGVAAGRTGLAPVARACTAMNRIGRSASSSTSPAAIDVSGTSAVGMHHRSSRSMA